MISTLIALASGFGTAWLAAHSVHLHNTARGQEVNFVFWTILLFLVFIYASMYSIVHGKRKRCGCGA